MAQVCEVRTRQYEADIGRLLERRLKGKGLYVESGPDFARANVAGAGQLEAFCEAVAGLLLYDLAHLELAARIEALPVSLEDKRMILPGAVRLAREAEDAAVRDALLCYFRESERLNLEGFVRFRMQDTAVLWDACVQAAAEDTLLESEYLQLISVLSAFVQMQPPRIKNAYIILNPDGSCTVSDDMDSRMNYESCTGDGVVSVLIGLAPERITVYDLSGGRGAMLADVLLRVFEDRVRYFK